MENLLLVMTVLAGLAGLAGLAICWAFIRLAWRWFVVSPTRSPSSELLDEFKTISARYGMMLDEAGVWHPTASAFVTADGLEHIDHCEECRARLFHREDPNA